MEFINDLAEKIVEAEVEEQERQDKREKQNEKPLDNDALVKKLENQADKLSKEQIQSLEELVKKQDKDFVKQLQQ